MNCDTSCVLLSVKVFVVDRAFLENVIVESRNDSSPAFINKGFGT